VASKKKCLMETGRRQASSRWSPMVFATAYMASWKDDVRNPNVATWRMDLRNCVAATFSRNVAPQLPVHICIYPIAIFFSSPQHFKKMLLRNCTYPYLQSYFFPAGTFQKNVAPQLHIRTSSTDCGGRNIVKKWPNFASTAFLNKLPLGNRTRAVQVKDGASYH
jgi:hypothetical protein